MRTLLALILPFAVLGCPSESTPPTTKTEPPPAPALEPSPAPTPVAPSAKGIDFVGTWATKDQQGEAFDMVIFANGQAITNWSKGVDGAKGERGFWRRDGNRLIAIYADGWTDMLQPDGDGFLHKGFAPGTDLAGEPTNSAAAVRVEGKTAAFTGVWRMNREPDGSYQYVALFSQGRALSTVGLETKGEWEVTENGARCTWPTDGWVDRIEFGTDGWQKRSWVGQETATPADVAPASRVGEQDFSITP